MKNKNKINTDSVNIVQLLSEEDVEEQFGEAAASYIATDQVVTWAKFVLTDDKPNANRQRIPLEEFDNILRTGTFKPVKMALGEIKDGHEDARPLGVITNLKRDGNKIVALAALWDHERSEDVNLIKEKVNANQPVNVSWEILYGNYRITDGISDLLDTVLRAVTIVGMPAYAGRTQLLAVAAIKWSPAYLENLPDSSFLHITNNGDRYFAYRDVDGRIDPNRFSPVLDEIAQAPLPEDVLTNIGNQVKRMRAAVQSDASIQELIGIEDFITEEQELDKELEGKVTELETKLAEATNALSAKEVALVEAQGKVTEAITKLDELTKEIEPLREFKMQAEEAAQKDAKLASIKDKFASAGIEKEDEYFSTNAESLLSLDENALDFMLQEMVVFNKKPGQASVDGKKSTIPNIPGEGGETSIKDLASALRERNRK